MKVGAALMIRQWGRDMLLSRGGVVLVSFKGRKYEPRAHEVASFALDNSFDQEVIFIVVAFEDLNGVVPQKFDVITFVGTGVEYTVQRGHTAGADEDEIVRILLKGGRP